MFPLETLLHFVFICSGSGEICEECMICTKLSRDSQLVQIPLTLSSDGRLEIQRLALTSKSGIKKPLLFHQRVNAILREEFSDKALKKMVANATLT